MEYRPKQGSVAMLNKKLVFLFALISLPVYADDAVEALSADIMFETTKELIMQDETLTVTKNSQGFTQVGIFTVDVDFHIKNTSDKDITRKIAFALPPVICNEETNATWAGLDDKSTEFKSFKDFSVTVDGKQVDFTKRIEAMHGNQIITSQLEKLGLPLNPCNIKMDSNGKYPANYQDAMTKAHLLENDNPAWRENIYFEWEQTFPAGQVINIHHRYTPVAGASVLALRSINEINSKYSEDMPTNYLWNRNLNTLATSNPNIVTKADNEQKYCVAPSWVIYNLKTGAQWNGGIGQFKLIVKDESGSPFAVNEFYSASDAVQTFMTKTTMTITIDNFTPKSNLLLLFLDIPTTESEIKNCGIQ